MKRFHVHLSLSGVSLFDDRGSSLGEIGSDLDGKRRAF